ncbi:MAG: GlsB/YeaQ/YmgE family stress response membrane protein [Bradyrhizobiaceae bacterium]|nr:GlsB/YeaQ/YmgE family stress response membrane protein [Bradyrhizobiaceae bacterium]
MHVSNHSLLVILAVGLVAGWLAGVLIKGSGFGLIGDVVIGWLGALIGHWLLPRLHIYIGTDIVAAVMNALIGAVVLLLVVRVLNGRGILYKRRWGRGW